jgi:lauroyl/myristoyl acyltransferase
MGIISHLIQDNNVSITLASLAGRSFPLSVLYALSDGITSVMSQAKFSDLYRSVAANQVAIRGETNPQKIQLAVKQSLRATARGLVDYYHFREHPQKLLERVHFDPLFDELFQTCMRKEQKTLMLILHMGNFDLAGQVIALRGLEFQILSYAHPGSGYQSQNTFRQNHGLIITPISIASLRQAEQRLNQNGTVLTGIDRPDPNVPPARRPVFFGRPASLSDAFIRMAMRLHLAVHLIACETLANGHTLVKTTPRIPIVEGKYNDEELVRQNLELTLGYGETWLRQHPEQWSMTYPVWPSGA